MRFKFRDFRFSDNGAVTVDWVVLCAAIVGIAGLLLVTIKEGTVDLADRTVVVTPG